MTDKERKLESAVRSLMGIVKGTIIGVWWTIGVLGTIALYFFQIPENIMQAIAFAAVSILYALLSKGLYKAKEIEKEANV